MSLCHAHTFVGQVTQHTLRLPVVWMSSLTRSGTLKRGSTEWNQKYGTKRAKTGSVIKNKAVIRRSVRPIQELKRTTQGHAFDISGPDYGYVLSYPFPDVGDLVNQRDGS